jgi:hypothetical protein
VYTVLRQHFRLEACYPRLLEDLLLSTRITTYGQALDLSSAAEYARVRGRQGSLDPFTMERYSGIVRYKTSHYSFVLPVHLAMRLAGVQEEGLYQQAAAILFDIGHYAELLALRILWHAEILDVAARSGILSAFPPVPRPRLPRHLLRLRRPLCRPPPGRSRREQVGRRDLRAGRPGLQTEQPRLHRVQ